MILKSVGLMEKSRVGGEYFCDVFLSTNGGYTWDFGTPAHSGDKQWMVIDRTGGTGEGNIYSFWTSVYSSCPPGFFTRSVDGGLSYEDCVVIPDSPYWGTMAAGPAGELYVGGRELRRREVLECP